ncbi:MAG TPA: alpha/beta hydrolase [Brumimicrobium sp.]|nr:alpha/beta hydrolase [Brumimicrobium sp.]
MNRILFTIIISALLFSCKQEPKMTLKDFIDLDNIDEVEMRDSTSKYYLTDKQLIDFKELLGELEQSEIKDLDTTKYNSTITFKGKPFKIKTSTNGELLLIPSSWISKNKDTLKTLVFKTDGILDQFKAEERIKIYAISGLGADQRVFKELDIAAEITPLEWITPKDNEAIEEYAKRLAKKIDTNEEYAIMGVSFGGLVATEVSKNLNPKYTILLSTVETKDELRSFFKLVAKHDLDTKLPAGMFNPPKGLANFMFGAEKKAHLNAILEDTDPHFSKWAIHEMMNWKNETRIQPVLKISGTKDRVIPAPDVQNIHLIKGTGHFMVVDRADEVSEIINKYISKRQYESKPNV